MYRLVAKLPHQKIIVACILSLIILAWTLDGILDRGTSNDIQLTLTMILKDRDSTLYAHDSLYATNELYQLYTPSYRWIADQVWQIYGSFEAGSIRLVPLIMGVYLVGMFILLHQVTGNPWISLGLTVASAHFHRTVGSSGWGLAGPASMGSRTLFIVMVPFVALLYLSILKEPGWRKDIGLGLVIGLLTNIHPVSGFHLLVLFLICLILVRGNTYRGWQTLITMGITAVIGAWPVISNFTQTTNQAVDDGITFTTFSAIVGQRYPLFFYPASFQRPLLDLELTRPTLDILVWFYVGVSVLFLLTYFYGTVRHPRLIKWCWLLGGLVTIFYAYMITLFHTPFIFIIVGLYIIYRFWQKHYSKLDRWLITLTGVIVFYAFVGYYLLTLIWQQFEVWALTSLLIEYARAGRFVYLPIYLLAGLAGVTVVKELLGNKTLPYPIAVAYLSLIAFALTLFGPLASSLGVYLPVPTRNIWQPGVLVAKPTFAEVDVELYDWVLQNTPPDSLFLSCFDKTIITQFLYKSRRSVTHNWKDLAYNIHNKFDVEAAYNRYLEFEEACHKNYVDLLEVAKSSGADYILFPSEDAFHFLSLACFSNKQYAVFSIDPNNCNSS
jgi:hypothetical protein